MNDWTTRTMKRLLRDRHHLSFAPCLGPFPDRFIHPNYLVLVSMKVVRMVFVWTGRKVEGTSSKVSVLRSSLEYTDRGVYLLLFAPLKLSDFRVKEKKAFLLILIRCIACFSVSSFLTPALARKVLPIWKSPFRNPRFFFVVVT